MVHENGTCDQFLCNTKHYKGQKKICGVCTHSSKLNFTTLPVNTLYLSHRSPDYKFDDSFPIRSLISPCMSHSALTQVIYCKICGAEIIYHHNVSLSLRLLQFQTNNLTVTRAQNLYKFVQLLHAQYALCSMQRPLPVKNTSQRRD